MNRDERRRTAKILGLSKGQPTLEEDACVLCAFVKVQIVGSRERLYKDAQGREIDLGISSRLEPPYGLRWPYDLQKRPPCSACGGSGKIETINLQKRSKDITACKECYGLGKRLRGDEFAPLCEPCATFVLGWLEARGRSHMEKHMTAGGRLVTATPGQLAAMLSMGRRAGADGPVGVAKMALPGIQR